jgi:hypothetical protein
MKNLKNILIVVVLLIISGYSFAEKFKGVIERNDNTPTTRATANCEPPRTSTELYVNNVKTMVHTGGDMWWDLQKNARYEVPAGSGCHALYAGSIWVGGLDSNGQLKMAAQKFRQRGIDFWPGPLIKDGPEKGNVSQEVCRKYDRHYYMTKEMVTTFRAYHACLKDPNCNTEEEFSGYRIPDEIYAWPGNNLEPGGYEFELAPFWDVDDDGFYDPNVGDFPYYEYISEGITFDPDCRRPAKQKRRIFGDHTLWWVYNDRGNIHTETKGTAIGMEFKSQAFAFTTNDELNDMTFYNYNITNRSTYTLRDTYFGVWTDADLGYPYDDYVGCDVLRGLGYSYNGDSDDETAGGKNGYGKQPPAIGIDFFEGPYQDADGEDNPSNWIVNAYGVKELICDNNDPRITGTNNGNPGDFKNGNINGLNFGDGEIDNERWGMRRFLYFNNEDSNIGDPATAWDHYNYITGFWKDGSPLRYGGNGHKDGANTTNILTDFMFPSDSDICGWGQDGQKMPAWDEFTENTTPADRRFVQSAGPFTLTPGAVNDITLGAVYARAAGEGRNWASVEAVKLADDKAQLLFENCFRVLNGPDAPNLKIIELDKKLIFHIMTDPNSNNYLESYVEEDPSIVCNDTLIKPCSKEYLFQGYQVYQLRNTSATASNRYDDNLVRQVFQCDIKDGVSQLVNYTWSDDIGANIPAVEVRGEDNGVVHSFIVDKDMFAAGSDNFLVNNKEYYYTVIAYAHNSTMKYNQSQLNTFNGIKKPYLAGRNNIKRYEAIPHKTEAEGIILQSDYGEGVEVTMVEGYGNANNIIELSQKSIDQIMQGEPWHVHNERIYEKGYGPMDVKIIDPLSVVDDVYYLKIVDVPSSQYLNIYGCFFSETARPIHKPFNYIIYNSKGDTIRSNSPITSGIRNEQIFPDWGFSISITMEGVPLHMDYNSHQNGFLSAEIEFDDISNAWLNFLPDTDNQNYTNWIRSGAYKNKEDLGDCGVNPTYDDVSDGTKFLDSLKYFGKILGGTWAPYRLLSAGYQGFAFAQARDRQELVYSEPLSSVDIVITKDRTKWTRSCVIEMCENEWTRNNCNVYVENSPITNLYSENAALKFSLRKSPSVDKDGNPDNSGTHGLGWFPGYAIDIRTGERLNIVFGEDSWLKGDNGRDMIWNPTSTYMTNQGNPVLGGKHCIYVFGNNVETPANRIDFPLYDECKKLHELLLNYESSKNTSDLEKAWVSAMWASIPLVNPSYIDTTSNDPYHFIHNDVKIKLRVATPYSKGVRDLVVNNPINNNFPTFRFDTKGASTLIANDEQKEDALDLIRVVPNPYYANSDYEKEQLDNYVRITNLPKQCEVSIYTISGTLVRKFKKDNDATFIEWDMKNSHNISISSGVYLFHVRAYNIEKKDAAGNVTNVIDYGEKIVKWFGVLRPIDLNNF